MPFSSLSHKKIGNIPCSQVPPGASTSYPIKNVGIFQVKPLDCLSLCPKHIPLLLLNGKNPAELSFSWDFPPSKKKNLSSTTVATPRKSFPSFPRKNSKTSSNRNFSHRTLPGVPQTLPGFPPPAQNPSLCSFISQSLIPAHPRNPFSHIPTKKRKSPGKADRQKLPLLVANSKTPPELLPGFRNTPKQVLAPSPS